MKILPSIPFCLVLGLIFRVTDFSTGAQLEIVTNVEPQRIFSGDERNIAVVWHNAGDKTADAEIHMRIFQASSSTAVQLSEIPWKKLQVLPQQTVVESVRLDFPAVKAETKFLIQWLENTNRVIGATEVLVYPTNLLKELKPLAGDEPLGVFDPQNQLKPLLKNLGVDFVDLGNSELEKFQGKLAVIGPFQSKAQMREGFAQTIRQIARKGASVVWIQPPAMPGDKIKPSFYIIPEGQGAVVVVQAALVPDLPADPKSQLNLLYFCGLSLHPQPLTLPDLSLQP
jgi:hypothetical protein